MILIGDEWFESVPVIPHKGFLFDEALEIGVDYEYLSETLAELTADFIMQGLAPADLKGLQVTFQYSPTSPKYKFAFKDGWHLRKIIPGEDDYKTMIGLCKLTKKQQEILRKAQNPDDEFPY